MDPQDYGCAQTPCPCSPGSCSSRGDTWVPSSRASATPKGSPHSGTEDHGHISATCLGHPQPVGTCGGAGSRGDTSCPFGVQGTVLEPPCRPLTSPGVGLQWKPLFGLEMAFSVSRAAQGANNTAEQIDHYSGRRKENFLHEVYGGWEHSLVPIMMWGSTDSRGSHSAWHSSFWALLPLGCSWSCGHFVWDTGERGGACCCLGRMRKRVRKG